MGIDSEKNILEKYGKIFEFSNLKDKNIGKRVKSGHSVRPMYLIKESQIEDFRNHILNAHSTIDIPQNYLRKYDCFEVNCIKKYEKFLRSSSLCGKPSFYSR